jgi:hypothetical protein
VIVKNITLANASDELVADYSLAGGYTKLFVRFGLSPDLDDLFTGGQDGFETAFSLPEVMVANAITGGLALTVAKTISNATPQVSATDDDFANQDTIPMRNHALVHQVELESQSTNFTLALSLSIVVTDADGDGLPAAWETANGLSDDDATGDNGANGDPDGDGMVNYIEWLVGLNPQLVDNSAYPKLGISRISGGVRLSFPTLPGRSYQLQSTETLNGWTNFGTPQVTAENAPPSTLQIDDTSGLPKRFYRMVVNAAP